MELVVAMGRDCPVIAGSSGVVVGIAPWLSGPTPAPSSPRPET